MRLVEKTRLYRQAGAGIEVYEVDLCKSAEDEYLVNIRFGRQGATLRESTKTIFPEPEAVAREIYQGEISAKRAEGYRDSLEEVPATDLAPVAAPAAAPVPPIDERVSTILSYLRQASTGTLRCKWPLSRIVWRAGELEIAEAAAPLANLDPRNDGMLGYCLVWALGRCGGDPEAIRNLAAKFPSNEAIQHLSAHALVRVLNDAERLAYLARKERELPEVLRQIREGNADTLLIGLQNLAQRPQPRFDFLSILYLFAQDYPHVHQTLLSFCRSVPLRPRFFIGIRRVLKSAELHNDAELLGCLIYRIETGSPYFRNRYNHSYVDGKYVKVDAELKKPEARLAYSNKTRGYLKRRMVRLLDRTGEVRQSERYTKVATSILLQFSDVADRCPKRTSYHYEWDRTARTSRVREIHYDDYAPYLSFNYLLYSNSPRYEASGNAWRTRGDWKPGGPVPPVREEAFPEFWDAHPDAVVRLLKESQCERVQEFAAKVFRANPSFEPLADLPLILDLLAKPYGCANNLALDLSRTRWSTSLPPMELVLALLGATVPDARQLGLHWLNQHQATLLADVRFVVQLICHPLQEIREEAKPLLDSFNFSSEVQEQILSQALAVLLWLDEQLPENQALAADAVETLGSICPERIASLDDELLQRLLTHRLAPLHAFAGRILLARVASGALPTDEQVSALIQSDSEAARTLGMELLGKFSDDDLLSRETLLLNLCISPLADLRQHAAALIGRFSQNADFSRELLIRLYPLILRKETYEGLHQDILAMVTGPLRGQLHAVPPNYCWRMLDSRYPAAQQLGWTILRDQIGLGALTHRQIVKLSDHDLKEIRDAVCTYYTQNPERIRQDLKVTLGIVDSEWEDVRQFAFEYFRATVPEREWTPELLVSVCDSTRADVQAFGRELVTQYFRGEDGPEYLLKFSQHPSAEIQTFATNYLASYAAGHLDRILALEPYFLAVLSRVNRGRVAKARILAFLKNEAMKSEEAAKVIIPILTRQSASVAIGERAACLEVLIALAQSYPHLETPVRFVEFPTLAPAT